METTINNQTSPVEAAFFAVLGGKFIVNSDGYVLDNDGNIIGDAHRIGCGWAVHTVPFAGTVQEENIIFVK